MNFLNLLLYIVTAISVFMNDILPLAFIDDRAPEWYYRLQWYKFGSLFVIGVMLYKWTHNMTTLLMLSYIALTLITIAIYYKYFDKEAKKRSEKRRRAYLEQPWEIRSTRPELKNY